MTRPIVLVLQAALIAAFALPAVPAQLPGTPVGSGDRVYGTIDSATDADDFSIPVAEGARIAVSVAAGKGSSLLPVFDLYAPDGGEVDLGSVIVGEGTASASLAGLLAATSGDYRVKVRGFGGSSGAYLATFGVLVEKGLKESIVVPAGEVVERAFPAQDGVAVSFSVTEKSGPALAAAWLRDPQGVAVAGADGVRRGARLSGKAVLDGGLGSYALVLEGGVGGPTTVDVKTSTKFPKVAKRKIRLGAEPRPLSMTPATGRDGALVTITGTDFVEGARIVFDGADEASSVTLHPDGSISGTSPDGAASPVGADATVAVVNPDGQYGIVPGKFRYLGRPGPLTATPAISPVAGGTTVVVTGQRFRAGATVSFGGVPATGVEVLGPASLTCVAPAHASGVVELVVSDEFGRACPLPVTFDYADAPTVTAASPASVPSFGGRTVTLTGTEFVSGDRVFVGGVEATGVVVASRTSLTFVSPAGLAGPRTVEVRDSLDRSGSNGGILALTESFRDFTATALPVIPVGTDLPGQTLVLGDLSGDGRADILVATSGIRVNPVTQVSDPSSRFLLNGGTGTFTDATASKFSPFVGTADRGQADALVLGDLDGTGPAEAFLSRATPLKATGSAVNYQGYPGYFLTSTPNVYDAPLQTATRALVAGGGGVFADQTDTRLATPTSAPAGGTGEAWQASATALGDLDGDGDLDLLLTDANRVDAGAVTGVQWSYTKVGSYYYGYYYIKERALISQEATRVGSTRVLRNGGGNLSTPKAGPAPLVATTGVMLDSFAADACAAGDLDGDGKADAVLLSKAATKREPSSGNVVGASALRVLFAGASATLTFDPTALPAAYADTHPGSGDFFQGNRVALGDLDGDGDLDIVLGREKFSYWTDGANQKHVLPAVRIFRNDGARKFSEATSAFLDDGTFRAGSAGTVLGVRGIAVTDVNRDGRKDLVLTGRETTVINVLGGFGPQGVIPAGTRPGTRVLLGNAAGKMIDATADRLPPVSAGNLFQGDAVSLADLDGDGKDDVVISMDETPADATRTVRVLMAR